jgi:uncharacterized protein (DUF2235 family)
VRLLERIWSWARPPRIEAHSPEATRRRGPVDHVVILDGTMSSLKPGEETNAGLTYRLLRELTPSSRLSVYYEAGIQWRSWRQAKDVLEGRGLNRQIRRAYGFLASRYHPGDRIFLFGYSRGAFAVRSLAGVIDSVGLLKADDATVRNVVMAYRHYQLAPAGEVAEAFRRLYCHDKVEIEMVGVWDTVKALGWPFPVVRRFSQPKHDFHSHELGPGIRRGFQALALDETRVAFEPLLWRTPEELNGRVEQVWFRGAHGDVGGMIGDFTPARPLSNVPLVWMLERTAQCGLPLPPDWRARFSCDPEAPSVGTWHGIGKLFWKRRARAVGQDPSEAVHPSAADWYRSHATRRWFHSFRTAEDGALPLSPP